MLKDQARIKDWFLFGFYSFVNAILLIQVSVGILTLLSNLNILMASIHQVCGVILVLSAINLYYKSIN